jgi:hypothetical protein
MFSQTIRNYMFYQTGLFHTIKQKNSGSSFSSDPASGGIPTLRPDGTLLYELTDLKNKRGRRKVLFFATDQIFKKCFDIRGVEDVPNDDLPFLQTYLRGFQAYGYDPEGNLAEFSSIFTMPIKNLGPLNADLRAEIYEKLSHKKHNGPEETAEFISADEVLIIDGDFIKEMLNLFSQPSLDTVSQSIYISRYNPRPGSYQRIFPEDSEEDTSDDEEEERALPDSYQPSTKIIEHLAQVRCAYFHVIDASLIPAICRILQFLPALEFLELSMPPIMNVFCHHPLRHLPRRIREQLVELRYTLTYQHRISAYEEFSPYFFPTHAESIVLSNNCKLDFPQYGEPLSFLREFTFLGESPETEQTAGMISKILKRSPHLTYLETTPWMSWIRIEQPSSVITAINIFSRAFSHLKFYRYSSDDPPSFAPIMQNPDLPQKADHFPETRQIEITIKKPRAADFTFIDYRADYLIFNFEGPIMGGQAEFLEEIAEDAFSSWMTRLYGNPDRKNKLILNFKELSFSRNELLKVLKLLDRSGRLTFNVRTVLPDDKSALKIPNHFLTATDSKHSTSPTNPLDFDPENHTPFRGQIVFIGSEGQEISPHYYLTIFSELELVDTSRPLIKKIEFNSGEPLSIKSEDTELRAKNQYQGRLKLLLKPSQLYPLPHLHNAKMLAIKLPDSCTLHQDPRTGQYGLQSLVAQEVIIEWLVQAQEPLRLRHLRSTDSEIFEDLRFEIRDSNIQLNRKIRWDSRLSDLEKIQKLGAWISGFESQDAKKTRTDFESPIDHLNAILQGKKGRCSERTFVFLMLMRIEFPEYQTYYVQNSMHAMPIVQFSDGSMGCFDLGGTDGELEIAPRIPSEASSSALAIPRTLESTGPAGAGGPARTPENPYLESFMPPLPVTLPLPFFNFDLPLLARPQHERIIQSITQKFLEKLSPQETLHALPFDLSFTRSNKPKNACLTLKDSQELSQALALLHARASTQDPDNPDLFIAESLESLRKKIFAKNPTVPTDPKFYLIESPFKKFLESTATPKILIISEDLLLNATGVSAYYPLLDSTRSIRPGLTLPADIQLVVLMQDGNMKKFREDFRSRFQIHGILEIGMAASGSSEEPAVTVKEKAPETLSPALITRKLEDPTTLEKAIRITPYNFHILFSHPELTPDGLIEHPGFLTAEVRGHRPLLLSGNLSKEQFKKLSTAQAKALENGEDFPEIFEIAEFPPTSTLEIMPVSQAYIPRTIQEYRASVAPENFTVLALPELGNPLMQFTQRPLDDRASGEALEYETLGEYSELVFKLRQKNQTILLHGKLSENLKAILTSIGTGTLFLAGQEIPIGEGSRLIILAKDRYAPPQTPAYHVSRLKPLEINPFCSIREGEKLTPLDLRPWEERLESWSSGRESTLHISAFDLMNPESRRIFRDLVLSSFSGQVLIHGRLKNLRDPVSGEILQTIKISGSFIPSVIKKYAQAFNAYERLEPLASTTTIMIDPSILFISEEIRLAQDAALTGTDIFLTESRRKLIAVVSQWLSAKEDTADHPLFLVEGPSGIGKSAVLRSYLKPLEDSGALIILSPSENLIREIAEANRNGKIIFIDELNTLRKDQLEAIEALVRSEPQLRIIGTQNPISFSGRAKLSPELLQHAVQFHLSEYPPEELMLLCQSKGISTEISEALVTAFLNHQKTHHSTFRDFLSAIENAREAYQTLMTREQTDRPAESLAFRPFSLALPDSSFKALASRTTLDPSNIIPAENMPDIPLLETLQRLFEGNKSAIHHYLEQLITGTGGRSIPLKQLKEELTQRLEKFEAIAASHGSHAALHLLYQTLKTLEVSDSDIDSDSDAHQPKSLLWSIAHQRTHLLFQPQVNRGNLKKLMALLRKVEAAITLSGGHEP